MRLNSYGACRLELFAESEGINTNILPLSKDFKSTSLNIHSNKNINNKIIIDKIKKSYDKLVYDLNNHNSLYVKKKYK